MRPRSLPSFVLSVCVLAAAAAVPVDSWALKTEKLKRLGVKGVEKEIEVVSEAASVRFRAGTPRARKDEALSPMGMKVVQERADGWTLVSLPTGMTVGTGLSLLQTVSGVLSAEPDHAYRALKTPSDPYVSSQYHLGKVNAYSAWEYGTGDQNLVTVAVIDSGIDDAHPDLGSKLVGVSQFCDPGVNKNADDGGLCSVDNPPTHACSHGTQVAGVAAALSNNGVGVAGLSWGAKLLSLKVFRDGDCNTSGDCSAASCSTDDWAIANAVDKAVALAGAPATYGKMVINISIGGTGDCPTVLHTSISAAKTAGIPVFAAAGNDGGDVNTPGNCADAIPVGATDENDNIAGFSSRGSTLSLNGFVAPGVNLYTTTLNGGYTGSATGTSFASPIGAGVAALLLAHNPAMTVDTVKSTLRGSAEGIGVSSLGTADAARPSGTTAGAGRLNAFRAMRLAVKGTLADFEGDAKAIAFPNPFRPSEHGNVTITIPTGLRSKNPHIRIYTMDGQLVRDLKGNTSWNGKNEGGYPVATGTYIFNVKTDAGKQNGRVAVIR